MNGNNLRLMLFVLALGSNMVFAEAGSVTIISPLQGATVSAMQPIKLEYKAMLSGEGDHLHLNVDGKRVSLEHALSGTITLDPLKAGKHRICLAENTKSHVPTGVEGCVDVVSK